MMENDPAYRHGNEQQPSQKQRSRPSTRQMRLSGGRTPRLVLRLYACPSIPDSSRKKPRQTITRSWLVLRCSFSR